jgi:hypothetical protein
MLPSCICRKLLSKQFWQNREQDAMAAFLKEYYRFFKENLRKNMLSGSTSPKSEKNSISSVCPGEASLKTENQKF